MKIRCWVILMLVNLFILVLLVAIYFYSRLDAANNYIYELEATYPDYIDTVSKTSAFLEYYNYQQ